MYVETVVQHLFATLRAPLIVLDADMSLVAHSVHEAVEHDATQVRMIVSRRGTSGAIASFERHGVRDAAGPVRLPGPDGGRGHIVVTLRSAGRPTGYLTFPDVYPDAIPEAHRRALDAATAQLGDALRGRAQDPRLSREHLRQLMEDLLSADDHRHRYAVRELTEARLIPTADSYLIALVSPSGSQDALCAAALDHLAATQGVVATEILGEAVLLVSGPVDPAGPLAPSSTSALAGCLVACGGTVETLAEVRKSLRQARIVLEGIRHSPTGNAPESAVLWGDLGADRILFQLPLDTMEASDLPEGVRRLLEHQNPRLRETVSAYVAAGGNAVETSRRLHLHRSTLYYRLEQVAEVTGLDLNDGGVRHEVHLALRVASLLGLPDKET